MSDNIIPFPAQKTDAVTDLDVVRECLVEIINHYTDAVKVRLQAVEALDLVEAMLAQGGAA